MIQNNLQKIDISVGYDISQLKLSGKFSHNPRDQEEIDTELNSTNQNAGFEAAGQSQALKLTLQSSFPSPESTSVQYRVHRIGTR